MNLPRIQEALIHPLDQQSTALAQLGHRESGRSPPDMSKRERKARADMYCERARGVKCIFLCFC